MVQTHQKRRECTKDATHESMLVVHGVRDTAPRQTFQKLCGQNKKSIDQSSDGIQMKS